MKERGVYTLKIYNSLLKAAERALFGRLSDWTRIFQGRREDRILPIRGEGATRLCSQRDAGGHLLSQYSILDKMFFLNGLILFDQRASRFPRFVRPVAKFVREKIWENAGKADVAKKIVRIPFILFWTSTRHLSLSQQWKTSTNKENPRGKLERARKQVSQRQAPSWRPKVFVFADKDFDESVAFSPPSFTESRLS